MDLCLCFFFFLSFCLHAFRLRRVSMLLSQFAVQPTVPPTLFAFCLSNFLPTPFLCFPFLVVTTNSCPTSTLFNSFFLPLYRCHIFSFVMFSSSCRVANTAHHPLILLKNQDDSGGGSLPFSPGPYSETGASKGQFVRQKRDRRHQEMGTLSRSSSLKFRYFHDIVKPSNSRHIEVIDFAWAAPLAHQLKGARIIHPCPY